MSDYFRKNSFYKNLHYVFLRMVFYLIGLGLSSPEDVSLKGLKIIQSAKRVYLEMYTGKGSAETYVCQALKY